MIAEQNDQITDMRFKLRVHTNLLRQRQVLSGFSQENRERAAMVRRERPDQGPLIDWLEQQAAILQTSADEVQKKMDDLFGFR
jgi:hypothetical protein